MPTWIREHHGGACATVAMVPMLTGPVYIAYTTDRDGRGVVQGDEPSSTAHRRLRTAPRDARNRVPEHHGWKSLAKQPGKLTP